MLAMLQGGSLAYSLGGAHGIMPSVARHAAPRAEAGPSPEQWREFRQKLVTGGLKLTTDEGEEKAVERRAVAPKNEELLKLQSQSLYEEYISGGWAHSSPIEAGGLLCRLPLQAQLIFQLRAGSDATWPSKMREQMRAELPTEEGVDRDALYEKMSHNTNYCYRFAERTISTSVRAIGERAVDGRIDERQLTPDERELVALYSQAQNAWQQAREKGAQRAPCEPAT